MEATVQRRETPAHDDAASQITRYSFRSIASHVFSPKEAEDPASPEGNQPRIGGVSATFLIFNRIMGTGVFATPGVIMQLTGSAGLSLMLWLLGTFIAISGAAVYLEFGTAIPKNGGEKNYLEYVYSKPMFLTTAVYATYAMCLGWCSSNSVVFGEYMLHAAHMPVGRWNQRLVGLACLTTAFMIQSVNVNWGLRITNILGMFKFAIVIVIIIGGCMALDGKLKIDERPDNLSHPFQGSTPSAYGIVTALYSVVFSYIGYANANYVLGETRNPEHTLKVAASMAVSIAGVIYMLINVAYFAAVPREDIMNLEAGKSIAALFFRNVFGSRAETALSVFVALSAFGTVQAILFSQGRIIQELGRQGVLPYSRFFASNKPFDSPAAGLFEHYVISSLIMILPPPGDAFKFLLNVISYPLSVINMLVSGGLLHIYMFPAKYPSWSPKIRATWTLTIFFFLSNIYLVISPFIPPPTQAQNVYEHLPYYLHCVVALVMFVAGGVYWLIWAVLMPRIGGYTLCTEESVDQDGTTRMVVVRRLEEKGRGTG